MRTCVRRSFDAATICIAFVIFCVLLTLAILVRISLPPAMRLLLGRGFRRVAARCLRLLTRGGHAAVARGFLVSLDDLLEAPDDVVVVLGLRVDRVERGLVILARERVHLGLE